MIKKLEIKEVLEPDVRAIDVVVWGGSRPHLFWKTIEAFHKHIKFDGRIRFFLEDGDRDHELALESQEIAQQNKFDGINIEQVNSYGYAMTNAMDRWVTSSYMFSLEDDWEFVRDIDLNIVIDLMDKYEILRQVRFNKRHTMGAKGIGEQTFYKLERDFYLNDKQYILTTGDKWTMLPALWKMSYLRPRWEGAFSHGFWHITNALYAADNIKVPATKEAPLIIRDKMGFWIWGKIGNPPYVKHNGGDSESVRDKML